MQKAIDFEFKRQVAAVEAGEIILQETRTFDSSKGITTVLRIKEEGTDYRYFTEPDLAPVRLSPSWIEGNRASLPELPRARKARYRSELGLSDYDAELLTDGLGVAAYFVAGHAPTVRSAKCYTSWPNSCEFLVMNCRREFIAMHGMLDIRCC